MKFNIFWTLLHELKTPDLGFHVNLSCLFRTSLEPLSFQNFSLNDHKKTKCVNSLKKQLFADAATLKSSKQVYNQHKETVQILEHSPNTASYEVCLMFRELHFSKQIKQIE